MMYASVTDTPFFQGTVKDEHRRLVESMFVERRYPKGQVIFFHGDEGHEMYIVKTGSVKIYRHNDDQEIIFGHQFPGETFGELEIFHYDHHRTASVATLEPSVLWMIKREDLLELSHLYPELLRKTIYILSERLIQADRKLEYLAFLDIRVRLANLLIDLVANFGESARDGTKITWRITQQHLANMIGASRESVARTLLDFQSEGIIQYRNKHLYILDLTTLYEMTGPHKNIQDNRLWHSTLKYDITSL